jgi:hypothetical protein
MLQVVNGCQDWHGVRTVDCSTLYLSAQSLFSDLHIIMINVKLITQQQTAILVVIQKTTSLQKKYIKLKK